MHPVTLSPSPSHEYSHVARLCLCGLEVPAGLLRAGHEQRLLLEAAEVHLSEDVGPVLYRRRPALGGVGGGGGGER